MRSNVPACPRARVPACLRPWQEGRLAQSGNVCPARMRLVNGLSLGREPSDVPNLAQFRLTSRFRPANLPDRASLYLRRGNLAPPEVPCPQGARRADVATETRARPTACLLPNLRRSLPLPAATTGQDAVLRDVGAGDVQRAVDVLALQPVGGQRADQDQPGGRCHHALHPVSVLTLAPRGSTCPMRARDG